MTAVAPPTETGAYATTDAERAVLGSVLIDPGCGLLVASLVVPADFWLERHRSIAEAVWHLIDHRCPVDILTVSAELERRSTMERAGGLDTLSDLALATPTAVSAEHYARMVAEAAWRRRMRTGLTAALGELGAGVPPPDVEATIDRARSAGIASERPTLHRLSDLMVDAADRLAISAERGGIAGLPTGMGPLDRTLGGLRPGRLYILAARPSLGKSTLGVQIAVDVAAAGRRTLVASAEMPAEEVADRLICWKSNVASHALATNGVDEAIGMAMGALADLPLWVEERPRISVAQIRARCRYLAAQGGLDLLVVDYAQLLSPENPRNQRVEQVSQISADLKGLAKEMAIPVILLSQLNRAVEADGREPRLSDLRDSGGLEQDADVVMFLWHDRNLPKRHDGFVDVELIVRKHRGGRTGRVSLVFDGPRFRFRSGP